MSQNYGAGNLERCKRATWVSMGLNFIATFVLIGFVMFFGKELLACFTDVASVIALGWVRILYVVLPEPISVVMETVSAAMRGYGYSLPPAMVTLICVCSIRIVWVYTIFLAEPTYEILMIVYPISWLVTTIVLVWLYFKHQKTLSPRRARYGNAAA